MQLCVFTEPQQGGSYEQLLRAAQAAEAGGFHGFFRSDHYLAMGSGDGLPGPTDAWATLAALARETSRVRLGTLMTSATFRLPGPLAITVAQVDEMSGGRVELGLGAGWFEAEHTAYGIPFPPVGERFDRFEEQLAVITGLWSTPPGQHFSHAGSYYPVADSPGLPKPTQRPGPPIIIGGRGARRTPALAARYAAEFNLPSREAAGLRQQFARVKTACEDIGRDPDTMACSAVVTVACGTDDAAIRRRAAAAGRDVDELRESGFAGRPDELVDLLADLAALGVSRAYLQFLDLDDLDHIALIAEAVAPHVMAASDR